jgi:Membrane-bound lysozyme-inhibitor of c-type lysozyme
MRPSSPCVTAALTAAAFFLSAFSGPVAPAQQPPVVPYVCEDGRPALAIYESGGDYLHAHVQLTYDGRTTELEAAPTLYGMRYRSAEGAGGGQAMVWSVRGEEGRLAETGNPDDVTDEGRQIARCTRLRSAGGTRTASAEGHGDDH